MKWIENWNSRALLVQSGTSSHFRRAGSDGLTDLTLQGDDLEGKPHLSALGASPHGSSAVFKGNRESCHKRKHMQVSHEHI